MTGISPTAANTPPTALDVERAASGPPSTGTAVLVGNPNVGKSVLFKNLTNHYVTVSNFPGTTVELVRARTPKNGLDYDVIDTPGVNDLTPHSDEARVTRELIDDDPDSTIVQVADAKNLRRALLLTLQLAELGRPMVLVLNMLDELEERGGSIDQVRLAELLGIPVVGTVASRNIGTSELKLAIPEARAPRLPRLAIPEHASPYERSRILLRHVNGLLGETYELTKPPSGSFRARLGFWAMQPVRGLLVLGAVLAIVFWLVGLFGAGTLVDGLEVGLFEQRLSPASIRAVDAVLPFPHSHVEETIPYAFTLPLTPAHDVEIARSDRVALTPEYTVAEDLGTGSRVLQFLHDFLVGEFGAITMAFSYALAIVLPIVTVFFLVFSVLEDSGYFPRMAIMVNKVFRFMGLNGKAVLPMILGLGCDTMATMTTRILETRKERIITTMLLALAIPCSAQLGVLLAMMATLSPLRAVAWLGIVIGVILLVGWMTARLFSGETSDFIMEIPPMRRPQLSNVVVKTVSRVNWYLREVIPIFVAGTALLFLLDQIHLLDAIARWGEPLVTGWLGLPREMANAFLIGFMRRDFGAVYLLDAATGPDPLLSAHQVFVAMVTITLFMPCIANFLMIAKEHGLKIAFGMAAFIFPFAFLVGGVVSVFGR